MVWQVGIFNQLTITYMNKGFNSCDYRNDKNKLKELKYCYFRCSPFENMDLIP